MFINVNRNNFFHQEGGQEHPQFNLLKSHIERAVQDLFLESLRTQSPELLYIFTAEEQIDAFVKRILTYWEELEKYEICQEVVNLTKQFKEKWVKRDLSETSVGLTRVRDLFRTKE
jgi:hypothetical protein